MVLQHPSEVFNLQMCLPPTPRFMHRWHQPRETFYQMSYISSPMTRFAGLHRGEWVRIPILSCSSQLSRSGKLLFPVLRTVRRGGVQLKTAPGLRAGRGGWVSTSLHVLWKDASLALACRGSWLHGQPGVVLTDSSGRWEPAGHPDSSAHLSLSRLGDQLPDPLTNFCCFV